MRNNYDRVAGIYDPLSRLVFGKSLRAIQTDLLRAVPPHANILIVGGGTGWILEEFSARHPADLNITYVEISENMLRLAKKRSVKANKVTFIHSAIEDFHSDSRYDIIFTAFLFDNFERKRIQRVFSQLDNLLSSGGTWLFADFHIGNRNSDFWQKLMLKTMLVFFQLVSQVEAKTLHDTAPLFLNSGYVKQKEYYRFGRFIHSAIYLKPSHEL